MTELNANGGHDLSFRGGVVLGGRQRTVVLSRDADAKLTILAKMSDQSPLDLLGFLVNNGIERGWQEMMVSKLMWVLANWTTWARWR